MSSEWFDLDNRQFLETLTAVDAEDANIEPLWTAVITDLLLKNEQILSNKHKITGNMETQNMPIWHQSAMRLLRVSPLVRGAFVRSSTASPT